MISAILSLVGLGVYFTPVVFPSFVDIEGSYKTATGSSENLLVLYRPGFRPKSKPIAFAVYQTSSGDHISGPVTVTKVEDGHLSITGKCWFQKTTSVYHLDVWSHPAKVNGTAPVSAFATTGFRLSVIFKGKTMFIREGANGSELPLTTEFPGMIMSQKSLPEIPTLTAQQKSDMADSQVKDLESQLAAAKVAAEKAHQSVQGAVN